MTRMICYNDRRACDLFGECNTWCMAGAAKLHRLRSESDAMEAAKSPLDHMLEKEMAAAVQTKPPDPQKGECWYVILKGALCVKKQIVSDITPLTIELCDEWNSYLKSRYRRVDVEMVEKCQ